MSIIGILKIMEVQEDDMEVQEEAVWCGWRMLSGATHNFISTLVPDKTVQFKLND